MDVSGPRSNYIVSGQSIDYFMIRSTQLSRKSSIHLLRQSLNPYSFSNYSRLDQSLKTTLDLTTIQGASAWLCVLSLGFSLHKAVFHDAVVIRYCWPLALNSISLCLWCCLLSGPCFVLLKEWASLPLP